MTPVADVCLVRTAGVPAAALDELRLRATTAALSQAARTQAATDSAAGVLEQTLHAAVPGLERPVRRVALRLKRDLHNGRRVGGAPEELERVAHALGPDGARRLEAWRELVAVSDATRDHARETARTELAAAEAALAGHLAQPRLRAAIALASPSFAGELARHGAPAPAGGRVGRTSFGYLVRAAAKTSPFSSFGRVRPARLSRAVPAQPERCSIAATPALALWLLHAVARDAELASALRFTANPTLRRRGDALLFLEGVPLSAQGFLWRRETVVELPGDWAQRLEGLHDGSYDQVLARTRSHTALVRLLDTDLVRARGPWALHEPNRVLALARAVGALSGPRAHRLAGSLRALSAELEGIAGSDASSRVTRIEGVRSRTAATLAELGRPRGHALAEVGVAYEDVAEPARVPALGPYVEADLLRLAALLRPRILRTQLYDELLAFFCSRYGDAGVCDDVTAFLVRFMGDAGAVASLRHAMRTDALALHARAPGPPLAGGPGLALAGASVLFQLAAPDAGALARGEHLLVVNQVAHGGGGLVARLTAPGDEGTRETLARWLADRCPAGARPWQISFAADWNGLQRPVPGLAPVLPWPGDVAAADDGEVTLDDLSLEHDRDSDTLVLRDRDGRPVVPLYTGTVPPSLVAGPAGLLVTLGDPWIVGPGPAPAGELGTGIRHAPREQDGRIVLSRRAWTVPADDFPRPRVGEAPDVLLDRAQAWRRGHELPEEVYVTAVRPRPALTARLRKPLWLAWDSPHALHAAAALVDGPGEQLRLAEALPGRREHWFEASDGTRRAAELVALLRCALSPEAHQPPLPALGLSGS